MRKSVGIDFGTSKLCVAVFSNQGIDVIANENDNRLTPCYVGFGDDEIHIGETAKHKATVNIKNTVYETKRLIGRSFDDKAVNQDIKTWGFDVVESSNVPFAKVEFHMQERQFRAEEVGAMMIRKMKEMAKAHLDDEVDLAVISVPACFNYAQRTAIKDAGIIAGFSDVFLVNEPTAAAIAYNLNNKGKKKCECILVFDLGAGTFDVSVCEINKNKVFVKASCGHAHFGGDDLDSQMVDHFVKEFQQKHRKDISKNKKAKCRLRYECEKAKRLLSASNEASIQLDCLSDDIDFRSTITRETFEEINKKSFEIIKNTIKRVLDEVGVKNWKHSEQMIEQVILVGGSSRIPKVRRILTDLLGENKLNRTLNADEGVAIGAAMLAQGLVQTGERLYADDISHSFYVDAGGKCQRLFDRNSGKVPLVKHFNEIFQDFRKGDNFQVFEHASEEDFLLGAFEIEDDFCNSRLQVDADGIFIFNPKVVKCKSGSVCSKMTDGQLFEMREKAEKLRKENIDWMNRSKARNDLEKFVYTFQQHASGSKYRKKISIEYRQQFLQECDNILKWIESEKTAAIEEYKKGEQHLRDVWDQILSSSESENQKLAEMEKEEEDERTKARAELFSFINEVKKVAKNYPGSEGMVQFCRFREKWTEKNMEESEETYRTEHKQLKTAWERFMRKQGASLQPPSGEAATEAVTEAEDVTKIKKELKGTSSSKILESKEDNEQTEEREDLFRLINVVKDHPTEFPDSLVQKCSKLERSIEIKTGDKTHEMDYKKYTDVLKECFREQCAQVPTLSGGPDGKVAAIQYAEETPVVRKELEGTQPSTSLALLEKDGRSKAKEELFALIKKVKDHAMSSQLDVVVQHCSDFEKWVEKNTNAKTNQSEYEQLSEKLKNFVCEQRESVKTSSELTEDEQKTAREDLSIFIKKVEDDAERFTGSDQLLQYCNYAKQWMESNRGANAESCRLEYAKLDNEWKNFIFLHRKLKQIGDVAESSGVVFSREGIPETQTNRTEGEGTSFLIKSAGVQAVGKNQNELGGTASMSKGVERIKQVQKSKMGTVNQEVCGQRKVVTKQPRGTAAPSKELKQKSKRQISSAPSKKKEESERRPHSSGQYKKESKERTIQEVKQLEKDFFAQQSQLRLKDKNSMRQEFLATTKWLESHYDRKSKVDIDSRIQKLKNRIAEHTHASSSL